MRKQFLFTCPLGPMASHSVIWNSWLMEGIVPWGLLHCCRSHLLCAPWDPWELKAWQGQLPGRTDSFSWEAAAMSKCLAGLMKRYSLPRVPRGRLWIKKETKNWVSCCLVWQGSAEMLISKFAVPKRKPFLWNDVGRNTKLCPALTYNYCSSHSHTMMLTNLHIPKSTVSFPVCQLDATVA